MPLTRSRSVVDTKLNVLFRLPLIMVTPQSTGLLRRLKFYLQSEQTFRRDFGSERTWEGLGILIWNLIVDDILTKSKRGLTLLKSELLPQIDELVSGSSLHLPWKDALPKLMEVAKLFSLRHVQWLATLAVPVAEAAEEVVVEDILKMISAQLECDLFSMGWDMLEALIIPMASEIVKSWSSYAKEDIMTAFRIWTFVLTHSGPTAGKHGDIFTPVIFHCLEVNERLEYGRLVEEKSAAGLGGLEMLSTVLSAVGAMAQFGYDHYGKPPRYLSDNIYSKLYYQIRHINKPDAYFGISLLVKHRRHSLQREAQDFFRLAYRFPLDEDFYDPVKMHVCHQTVLDVAEEFLPTRADLSLEFTFPHIFRVAINYINKDPSRELPVKAQLERMIRSAGKDPEYFKHCRPFSPPCEWCLTVPLRCNHARSFPGCCPNRIKVFEAAWRSTFSLPAAASIMHQLCPVGHKGEPLVVEAMSESEIFTHLHELIAGAGRHGRET